MGIGGSERLPCHHEMVIGEINRSHQLVSKLRSLLLPSPTVASERWPELANDLFEEVLQSYKVSVSMLLRPCSCFAEDPEVNASQGSNALKEVAKNREEQSATVVIGCAPVPRKVPPSRTSTSTQNLESHHWKKPAKKKISNADIPREERKSWTTVTHAPHFDGHQWRKYGEKHISNSEFPRNYYRCSHFKERGCQATKTIQQKDGSDEPAKFIVNYKMHHTCKSMEPLYSHLLESKAQIVPVISFAPGNASQRGEQNETDESENGFKSFSSSTVPMMIDLNSVIES